ncbi:MAG: choice-of-anchor R domain-containing protein [Verrucomicrobiota bacterium]
MKPRILALSLALACFSLQQSRADVVVSNLGEPISPTYDSWGVFLNNWVGMKFTTGSNSPSWSLASVDMMLVGGVGLLNNDLTVRIHADNSGQPGLSLFSLTGPEPAGDNLPAILNYVPTAPATLASQTSYWLVASTINSHYGWTMTEPYSGNDTGLDGWSIDDGIIFTQDQGSSWIYYNDEPALFAINTTVVPEPGTFALLGLGAAALLARRRRA